MNPRSFLSSAGATALGICALLISQAAPAASIGFTPRGSNVDLDPIRDYLTLPGQEITVAVSFQMLSAPFALTDISYTLHYDTSELMGLGYEGGENHFAGTQGIDWRSLAAPIVFKTGGVYADRPFIDYFRFVTLPGIQNDGLSDVWITLNSHNDIGAAISTTQMLDVQAIPEPGTLLLLSAGLGVIAWRSKQRAKLAS